MKRQQIIRSFIRGADRALSIAFTAVLLLLLFFALYVNFNNRRILKEAGGEEYQSYKPTSDDTLSFDELVAINPDVTAWLTIDDTQIDYPLVQSYDNELYINTSVFREFSLSGALFLDYRNRSDFTDPLSIVYGHNMTGGVMFGGIDRYADPDYFSSHRKGTLYSHGAYYKLEIFAYFRADGHDLGVYAPELDADGCRAWLDRVGSIAVNRTEEIPDHGPILLMSTCSTDTTNGRDLLAASILPGGSPPPAKGNGHISHPGSLLRDEDGGSSLWPYLIVFGAILVPLTVLFVLLKRRKKESEHDEER